MSDQDGQKPPRAVFIEGDPFLVLGRIAKIKASRHGKEVLPAQWVTVEAPDGKKDRDQFILQALNGLAAELATPSWDDSPKTVVLRGIFDDDRLISFLTRTIPKIPDGSMLIIWDESGTSRVSGKWEKLKEDWDPVRKECTKRGKILSLPPSLYSLKEYERVDAVVDYFKDKGKVMSKDTASVLLDMIGPDRAAIKTEAERILLVVDSHEITTDDILSETMPVVEMPPWRLYGAMNRNDYEEVLRSADKIVSSGKDWVFVSVLLLRAARLQLLAACAEAKGLELKETVTMGPDPKRKLSLLGLPVRHETDDEPDKSTPPSPHMVKELAIFVKEVMPGLCPPGADYGKWLESTMMSRYLRIYRMASEIRVADNESQQTLLGEAVREAVLVR